MCQLTLKMTIINVYIFRYHNGKKLSVDRRIAIDDAIDDKDLYGSTLVIDSLEMSDGGEFKAIARNCKGEDATLAILTVDSKEKEVLFVVVLLGTYLT